MAIKIAYANHKGGVGKTVCVVNTAYRLAKMGYKVLVVDCDAQGNATFTLGNGQDPQSYDPSQTMSAIFSSDQEPCSLAQLAMPTETPNLFFIPNNLDIYAAITSLSDLSPRRFYGILNAYELAPDAFDFILFDTPPSLEGVLLTNALITADHVIIVVESESTYALTGIKNLIRAISTINREIKNKTSVLGYLLTKFDGRTKAAKVLQQAAADMYGANLIFSTGIPNSTRVNQSIMQGVTICEFDPDGGVCKAFKAHTQELLARLGLGAKKD
ncbi:ParA family protein (plasmid) [Nitratidesulfovibrio vulgaris]|jgi:chromosome partitioning protein|nr:ParA family protein [Nitratidesulfovibrio vulgaris]WCB48162.1 ParA family protein [Nitratidesulfovibrio vulgaris]